MLTRKVFVIIPVYNEQEVYIRVLEQFAGKPYHLVLVDDGSTIPVTQLPPGLDISLLRHTVNLGQGAALQTGTDFALRNAATHIVHFDGDGQHDADDVERMLIALDAGNMDMVFGSRFLSQPAAKMPLHRRILLHAARFLNFIFCGILLSDAHNGMRALNRHAAASIRLRENGMAHASEILFAVQERQLRYVEIPVRVVYTPYSLRKGQSSWSSIRVAWEVLLHKIFAG